MLGVDEIRQIKVVGIIQIIQFVFYSSSNASILISDGVPHDPVLFKEQQGDNIHPCLSHNVARYQSVPLHYTEIHHAVPDDNINFRW
jgi:hypothetical protein